LVKKRIAALIHKIKGSVKIAPSIEPANAIFHIVGTGSTPLSNGLKEVETVIRSEVVLMQYPHISAKKKILDQLLSRIQAVNRA